MSGGQVAVGLVATRGRLGARAFFTWTVLLSLRDKVRSNDGVIWPSLAWMIHSSPSLGGAANVRDALRRLSTFGLVENIGWRGGCFLRRVHGALAEAVCYVPNGAAEKLQEAYGWGGKRAGAGRPTRTDSRNQVPRDSGAKPNSSTTREVVSPLSQHKEHSSSTKKNSRAAMMLPHQEALNPSEHEYPSISLVPPPSVPSPPRLDPALSDAEKLKHLVRLYNSAVSFKYKKHSFARIATKQVLDDLSGEKVRVDDYDSPKCKPILAAANYLAENGIAPAAWLGFSIDVWREHSPSERPPPMKWVWSVKRLKTRMTWFDSELNNYVGKRLIYGPAHRKLLERYEAFEYEVHQRADAPLPSDFDYHGMVKAAIAEGARMQQDIDARVAHGEWLWL